MNGKLVVFVFLVVIIVLFAYYYPNLPQTSSAAANQINKEAEQALGNATEIKGVTGTLVEIGNENLMIRTADGVLTIKKSAATKYVELVDGSLTAIDERELRENDEVAVAFGVDAAANEAAALSVSVLR